MEVRAASTGQRPDGAWVATEVRFVLYRFAYSRLGDDATDAVYDEEVKSGAKDEQTPGSQEALARFIADVAAGNVSDDTSDGEVARMRAALQEWGEVKSIRFTGTAGGPRWITHNLGRETVEVQWNKFEVHHERATSEWLIAVDREGTVWNARASRARLVLARWRQKRRRPRTGPPAFHHLVRTSEPVLRTHHVATTQHIVQAARQIGDTRATDGARRLRRSVVEQVRDRAVYPKPLQLLRREAQRQVGVNRRTRVVVIDRRHPGIATSLSVSVRSRMPSPM